MAILTVSFHAIRVHSLTIGSCRGPRKAIYDQMIVRQKLVQHTTMCNVGIKPIAVTRLLRKPNTGQNETLQSSGIIRNLLGSSESDIFGFYGSRALQANGKPLLHLFLRF